MVDPYVYPGTDVLKNIADVRDAGALAAFEAAAAYFRTLDLERDPIRGRFDRAHIENIHRYLFQDVYEWAGTLRTVDIARSTWFAKASRLAESLDETFARLAREPGIVARSADRFVDLGGTYLGEINAHHPFREGNGRAQREFVRELAVENGFDIDWSAVSGDEMTRASKVSLHNGDQRLLVGLIRKALVVLD